MKSAMSVADAELRDQVAQPLLVGSDPDNRALHSVAAVEQRHRPDQIVVGLLRVQPPDGADEAVGAGEPESGPHIGSRHGRRSDPVMQHVDPVGGNPLEFDQLAAVPFGDREYDRAEASHDMPVEQRPNPLTRDRRAVLVTDHHWDAREPCDYRAGDARPRHMRVKDVDRLAAHDPVEPAPRRRPQRERRPLVQIEVAHARRRQLGAVTLGGLDPIGKRRADRAQIAPDPLRIEPHGEFVGELLSAPVARAGVEREREHAEPGV